MQESLARWRKAFWIACAALGLGLFAEELGLGLVAQLVSAVSATVAGVSFITLLADPASRQPRVH